MRIWIAAATIIVLMASAAPATAQEVKIKRWVIGSGGMLHSNNGDNLRLSGQLGQVAIGKISGTVDGNTLDIYQGFWVPVDEIPTNAEDSEPNIFSFVNYPNPFSQSTSINLNIPVPGHLSLKIYDVAGSLIATLSDGYATNGEIEFKWIPIDANGAMYGSGTYICEMQFRPALGYSMASSSYTQRILMILAK